MSVLYIYVRNINVNVFPYKWLQEKRIDSSTGLITLSFKSLENFAMFFMVFQAMDFIRACLES